MPFSSPFFNNLTQFSEVLLKRLRQALVKIPVVLSVVALVSALFSQLSVNIEFGGMEI